MKTFTLIAAGLLVSASAMAAASTIQLLRRSPLDHIAYFVEQARVQITPGKKPLQVPPRPMLGLPRNG